MAWESELKSMSKIGHERSETNLKLKSQLQAVTMERNDAIYRVKKVENEI